MREMRLSKIEKSNKEAVKQAMISALSGYKITFVVFFLKIILVIAISSRTFFFTIIPITLIIIFPVKFYSITNKFICKRITIVFI
jgi:hypothetical protein